MDNAIHDHSQHQSDMILESVHDAIITFSVEGEIVSINKAAKTMLMIEGDSQSIGCYLKGFDIQQKILDYMGKVKNQQVPESLGLGFRSWARRSDNSLFPIDISLSHNESGPAMIIAVIRDVSDRKRIENELQAEQILKSRVIEQSLNAIIVVDEAGIVKDFNISACRVFGYLQDEVIGRSMAELIIPQDQRENHLRGMRNYLKTGKGNILNKRVEVLAMRKNRELFPIELTVFPIHSMGKTVYAAAIQDITERKQEEIDTLESKDNAEKANQFKSQFLAAMSHEIRTPMNAVLGLLGLLQETNLNLEQRKYISTALESGQGLLTLINDILDFSKIEAGKLTLEHHDFNVSQTIYGIIELMQVRANNKNISLASYIDPKISEYLSGDQGRIRQILLNLISNAIKFTDQGSVVVRVDALEFYKDRYSVCISVEDTGIGIKEGDQNKLFDDFVQVDGADNRRYGGSGLGLSISKKLVDMMGGRIELESEEGKGSCFSVYLKLEQGRSIPVSYFPMRLEDVHIAMICGTRTDTLVIKDQLQSMGAKISTVPNVESVFSLFEDSSVDIMLADYRELAYEADRFIDEFSFYFPNIPCLLLMDRSNHKIDDHFKRLGFSDCLSVCVRRNVLADIIDVNMGRDQNLTPDDSENVIDFHVDGSIPFRILLAEDSQANQLVAMNVLENAGYSVDAVANGIEAIKAMQNLPYDVILMDLQMPEMGGLEATQHIRKLPSSIGEVPIFAMTANVFGEMKAQCKSVGMNGFISKPINKHELFARLSILYESKKQSLIAQQTSMLDYEQDRPEYIGTNEVSYIVENKAIMECRIISEDVFHQLIEDTSLTAVQRMLDIFNAETIKRIALMEKLIVENSWGELKCEAHTLKSSAASYGAIKLSTLAGQMEADIIERGSIHSADYDDLTQLSENSLQQLHQLLSVQNA
jgi:PAS domain S-box-containing protein